MARRRNGDGDGDDPAKILEDLSPVARRWVESHPVPAGPDPGPPAGRASTVEFTTVIGNPKVKVRSKGDRPAKRGELVLVWASDIQEEAVDWLWEGRIPLGMMTLVSGDKGAGKSSLASWMAAVVSAGGVWPGETRAIAPGRVLYLNAEEHTRRAWRPRLARFGADVGRIALIDSVRLAGAGDDETVPFSFQMDMETLREKVAELKDVRLIVVDTISSYLLSIDAGNGAEVRRALEPLKRLAEAHNIAVVLNNHLNKGAGTKAIYRSKDSIDIPNLARMTWLIAPDPDDRARRILAPSNCNFDAAPALAFGIDREGRYAWDPKPLEGLDASDLLAREAQAMARAGKAGRPAVRRRAAKEWLLERLASGPALLADVVARGQALCFARSTLLRCLDSPDVEQFDAEGGRWVRLAPRLDLREEEDGGDA